MPFIPKSKMSNKMLLAGMNKQLHFTEKVKK